MLFHAVSFPVLFSLGVALGFLVRLLRCLVISPVPAAPEPRERRFDARAGVTAKVRKAAAVIQDLGPVKCFRDCVLVTR